jgi:hypothetical protein
MALTDTAVRQAKATGKAYTLGDIDGLSLAISQRGGKSWHFRYYWGGVQKRMSLGTYPEVSLREARQARDEARALLAKGTNPHTHRKQKRQAVRMACEHTFEAVFHQWLEHHAQGIKTGGRSTYANIVRMFDHDVLPVLGKRSILEIRRPDLLEVIERIEKRGARSISDSVRGYRGEADTNPDRTMFVVARRCMYLRTAIRDAGSSSIWCRITSSRFWHGRFRLRRPFGLFGGRFLIGHCCNQCRNNWEFR